jgi:hypothetical protein
MENTATSAKELAKARRIHNARHAKALVLADTAEAYCRQSGTTARELALLPESSWLTLAILAGKAGPKDDKVPSPETRAIVVDLVEGRL